MMEDNIRFIAVLDELKQQGRLKSYATAAELCGTNKAAINDVKTQKKRLSVELLRGMKLSYPEINLDWIVLGEGSMFVESTMEVRKVEKSNGEFFDNLMDRIERQSEIIGEQRREIAELKRRLEKNAASVSTDSTARVG